MSEFQERLWSELVRDHGPALAYPRGWHDSRRPLAIVEDRRTVLPKLSSWRAVRMATVGAVVLAVVVAAVLLTTGTSTSPQAAYGVTETPDGAVHVTISELTEIVGANAQLAKLGVRARIVPMQAGCSASGTIVSIPETIQARVAHGERQGVVIQPRLIPSADTLVIAARHLGTAGVVGMTFALYRGPIPPCVAPGYSNVR